MVSAPDLKKSGKHSEFAPTQKLRAVGVPTRSARSGATILVHREQLMQDILVHALLTQASWKLSATHGNAQSCHSLTPRGRQVDSRLRSR